MVFFFFSFFGLKYFIRLFGCQLFLFFAEGGYSASSSDANDDELYPLTPTFQSSMGL